MFLDLSIFDVGNLLIVNANKPNKSEYSTLVSIVERNEKDFIMKCLGSLGASYIEGLEQTTPDQKWIDLRDGADYLKNGVTLHFNGLNEIEAHYIWFLYQEKVSQSTANGELQVSSEQVDNTYLLVNRWNEMVNLIGYNENGFVPCLKDFLEAGDYEDANGAYEFKYKNQLI